MEQLRYGDRVVHYEVSPTSRLNAKILIHVHPEGHVEVEAPLDASAQGVRLAVQKRARWIIENLDTLNEARSYALPREYVGGETHFYLGRRYRLRVTVMRGTPSTVQLVRGCIEVTAPSEDPVVVKRRLELWYRTRGEDYFGRRLTSVVSELDWVEAVPPFKLLAMDRQWGSCSPSGTLHLNPALIRAPRHCIDYVLTHELCHLKEHNHSKRFYALLQQHSPNWKECKVQLDNLAYLLLAE